MINGNLACFRLDALELGWVLTSWIEEFSCNPIYRIDKLA